MNCVTSSGARSLSGDSFPPDTGVTRPFLASLKSGLDAHERTKNCHGKGLENLPCTKLSGQPLEAHFLVPHLDCETFFLVFRFTHQSVPTCVPLPFPKVPRIHYLTCLLYDVLKSLSPSLYKRRRHIRFDLLPISDPSLLAIFAQILEQFPSYTSFALEPSHKRHL